ncbi:Serine palmitoyltransferase 1 [Lachancea thermotolerans]
MRQPPEVLPSSIPVPEAVLRSSSYVWYYCQRAAHAIPGMHYVVSYVRKSHQDDPYRTLFELFLIIYGIIYFFRKPRKQGEQAAPKLSEREVEALLDEWEPEPIAQQNIKLEWRAKSTPVLMGNSSAPTRVNLTRDEGRESYSDVLNCASTSFLQISSDPEFVKAAKDTIHQYGVGACGPAGFYGNQDVHSELEYNLARFFGTERAVLYGQDFCIAASVIPAFTKRGDVIVADDRVNVALQNALQLSRSTVYYYNHNDMEALEELLEQLQERELNEKLPSLPRKFIVTEGLFQNLGDIPDLPRLVELKRKYKYRLLVDETFSLGVLGANGRGIAEYYNMKRDASVDITIGSLAVALGSSGGFVLGDNVMSMHQRIGSHAYTFSAALPAFAVTTASRVLDHLEHDNSAVQKLRSLSQLMHQLFIDDSELSPYIEVTSFKESSILHFRLTDEYRSRVFHTTEESLFQELSAMHAKNLSEKYIEGCEREEKLLQRIVDMALKEHKVLLTRNTFVLKHETLPVTPSLKLCCSAKMTEDELRSACESVKSAVLACTSE